jgi:predicted SprT family Zn-dependent metalloprotease
MINHTPFQHLIDAVIAKYNAAGMPVVDFAGLPLTFYMNDRMRTVGGVCQIKPIARVATIQLNTQLFATLDDAARQKIIAHELAHAVAFFLGYVREHHGARWQRIARAMGDTGERCHTLEVKHNLVRRVIYAHRVRGNIYALSPKKAKTLGFNTLMNLEFVGEVEIDRDSLSYRWKHLRINELREVKIFVDKFKLVA